LELHIGPGGSILEFHPNVTVVNGLSPAARDEVIRAVTALPAGGDPGLTGLVEAHGVLFDLTRETLELFGLGSTIDVLVRSEDLPGQNGRGGEPTVVPTAAAAPPTAGAEAPPADSPELARARRELDDANEAFSVLEEAHGRAERQCGVASETRQKIMNALDNARRERDQARARVDGADGALSGPGGVERDAELRSRIDQLTAARDELASALDELTERDPRPIEVLVDEYHKPPSSNMVPSPEAGALADEFVDLQAKLADLESRREAEGRGTESTMRQLDEAREALANAERSVAKPEMSPDDIAELEAAHEAVLEAEKKASGRLGRKSGQKLLDDASEAEQRILDRVGFPTWSSYVMGSTLLNIDPIAEQALERARDDMALAEAAWEELTHQLEHDPEYSELLDRLEAVYLIAFDILGGNDEGDLEYRLREVMVAEEEVPKEDVVEALRYQLSLVGVDVDDRALPEVVVRTAEDWLAETHDHWEKYRALQEEHVRVENDLAATERELEMFGIATQELDDTRDEREAVLHEAEAKVAEILSDLEQATELESELVAQLEAREMLMGAARFSVTAAQRKVTDAEAAMAKAANAIHEINSPESKDTTLYDSLPYAAEETEAGGEPTASADDIEFYFLSRLSALRSVSHAGSVPLLIDDALHGFPPDQARHVLDKLDEMSESVQVIYLTDDDHVTSWADTRGIERAAVVRVASSIA
jgi:hypothetical protein